jgi:hypothetical protein
MERNVCTGVVPVELDIKRRRVRRQCELRSHAHRLARVVRKRRIWREYELISHRKLAIGNRLWSGNAVACRIAVPVSVLLRWVAQVVHLVSRIISVYIDSDTANGAVQLVSRVLYAPEPAEL